MRGLCGNLFPGDKQAVSSDSSRVPSAGGDGPSDDVTKDVKDEVPEAKEGSAQGDDSPEISGEKLVPVTMGTPPEGDDHTQSPAAAETSEEPEKKAIEDEPGDVSLDADDPVPNESATGSSANSPSEVLPDAEVEGSNETIDSKVQSEVSEGSEGVTSSSEGQPGPPILEELPVLGHQPTSSTEDGGEVVASSHVAEGADSSDTENPVDDVTSDSLKASTVSESSDLEKDKLPCDISKDNELHSFVTDTPEEISGDNDCITESSINASVCDENKDKKLPSVDECDDQVTPGDSCNITEECPLTSKTDSDVVTDIISDVDEMTDQNDTSARNNSDVSDKDMSESAENKAEVQALPEVQDVKGENDATEKIVETGEGNSEMEIGEEKVGADEVCDGSGSTEAPASPSKSGVDDTSVPDDVSEGVVDDTNLEEDDIEEEKSGIAVEDDAGKTDAAEEEDMEVEGEKDSAEKDDTLGDDVKQDRGEISDEGLVDKSEATLEVKTDQEPTEKSGEKSKVNFSKGSGDDGATIEITEEQLELKKSTGHSPTEKSAEKLEVPLNKESLGGDDDGDMEMMEITEEKVESEASTSDKKDDDKVRLHGDDGGDKTGIEISEETVKPEQSSSDIKDDKVIPEDGDSDDVKEKMEVVEDKGELKQHESDTEDDGKEENRSRKEDKAEKNDQLEQDKSNDEDRDKTDKCDKLEQDKSDSDGRDDKIDTGDKSEQDKGSDDDGRDKTVVEICEGAREPAEGSSQSKEETMDVDIGDAADASHKEDSTETVVERIVDELVTAVVGEKSADKSSPADPVEESAADVVGHILSDLVTAVVGEEVPAGEGPDAGVCEPVDESLSVVVGQLVSELVAVAVGEFPDVSTAHAAFEQQGLRYVTVMIM